MTNPQRRRIDSDLPLLLISYTLLLAPNLAHSHPSRNTNSGVQDSSALTAPHALSSHPLISFNTDNTHPNDDSLRAPSIGSSLPPPYIHSSNDELDNTDAPPQDQPPEAPSSVHNHEFDETNTALQDPPPPDYGTDVPPQNHPVSNNEFDNADAPSPYRPPPLRPQYLYGNQYQPRGTRPPNHRVSNGEFDNANAPPPSQPRPTPLWQSIFGICAVYMDHVAWLWKYAYPMELKAIIGHLQAVFDCVNTKNRVASGLDGSHELKNDLMKINENGDAAGEMIMALFNAIDIGLEQQILYLKSEIDMFWRTGRDASKLREDLRSSEKIRRGVEKTTRRYRVAMSGGGLDEPKRRNLLSRMFDAIRKVMGERRGISVRVLVLMMARTRKGPNK